MNISLAITTFNRFSLTVESFEKVINDPRINEIVIVDDYSSSGDYEKLREHCLTIAKVKLHRNQRNLGMSLNKARALELCTNDWCIIFDSDNVIDSSYIDALQRCNVWEGTSSIIYCPSFAKPDFDYREFEGMIITQRNVSDIITTPMGNCLLNTCNYLVNRKQYLKIFSHNPDHIASDTIWFNYLWLKASMMFYVVPGMHYEHRVHKGSGFMQDAAYNMRQAESIKKMIMAL